MKNQIQEKTFEILRKYSKYLLIFLLFIFLTTLSRSLWRIKKINEKMLEREKNLERLKKENERLKEKLEEIKSDEYLEKQIRDNLGLAKEGEIVVVLPEEEVLRSLAPDFEEEKDLLPDPNWKKWLQLFNF